MTKKAEERDEILRGIRVLDGGMASELEYQGANIERCGEVWSDGGRVVRGRGADCRRLLQDATGACEDGGCMRLRQTDTLGNREPTISATGPSI
jgi:hypothetical protein